MPCWVSLSRKKRFEGCGAETEIKDPDGGLTLYIQNSSPGEEQGPNWLPAPPGPFTIFMRVYWPKPEALDGTWQPPKLVKVS